MKKIKQLIETWRIIEQKTKDFNHTRMVNLQYGNIWSTY